MDGRCNTCLACTMYYVVNGNKLSLHSGRKTGTQQSIVRKYIVYIDVCFMYKEVQYAFVECAYFGVLGERLIDNWNFI